jgi:hypothetical protein
MWYNLRPMLRRNASVALLAMIALQLLGGMAFASVCPEPCPDDTDETSCPPVCALCTGCTHAQTAIVQHSANGSPFMATARFLPQQTASASSQLAADIFHVPLAG